MDSSTRCSRKLPDQRRRFLRHTLALGLAARVGLEAGPVRAAEADIRNVALTQGDEQYVLHADIIAELTPLLADVVSRGVSLYFVTEFELSASRWYWLDEEISI